MRAMTFSTKTVTPLSNQAEAAVRDAAAEDARLLRADSLRVAAEAFANQDRTMADLLWASEWILGDFTVNTTVDLTETQP